MSPRYFCTPSVTGTICISGAGPGTTTGDGIVALRSGPRSRTAVDRAVAALSARAGHAGVRLADAGGVPLPLLVAALSSAHDHRPRAFAARRVIRDRRQS